MKRFNPASAISDAISQEAASRFIGKPRHGSTDDRVSTFYTDADSHVYFVQRREYFWDILWIILSVAV
jgi:hypothetical protein